MLKFVKHLGANIETKLLYFHSMTSSALTKADQNVSTVGNISWHKASFVMFVRCHFHKARLILHKIVT